jgi:hypothetical protein
MDVDTFYPLLKVISEQAPDQRHRLLGELHTSVVTRYLETLEGITAEGAQRIVPDGRTVTQVVGHIAEWERYVILSAGEVLAGVEWPGLVAHTRYVEPDGTMLDLHTNHAFNAHQAEKYTALPWQTVQSLAIDTATTCHRLFAQSGLLTAERFERTRSWDHYDLPIGVTLKMPCGWFLWMITIEHEAVEHVNDLALGQSR